MTNPTTTIPSSTLCNASSVRAEDPITTAPRVPEKAGLKVRTRIKAGPGGGGYSTGGVLINHNQSKAGLKVKSDPGSR